jgi:hypothetical protein
LIHTNLLQQSRAHFVSLLQAEHVDSHLQEDRGPDGKSENKFFDTFRSRFGGMKTEFLYKFKISIKKTAKITIKPTYYENICETIYSEIS